jgi:hypothetical protein
MTKRTDIHRPAAIMPADYRFVAFECVRIGGLEDCHIQMENRRTIRADMERTGGNYSTHAHGGNCMVCGNANAIYTALFHHEPSNSYVRMGSECTEKVDMQLDRAAFTRFKDGMAQWRTAQAGKNKAKVSCEDRNLTRAWDIFASSERYTEYEEQTIRDMINKLVRYGSLSDKQWAFMGKLVAQIDTREARKAQRAAEVEAALPIPAEMLNRRVKIEGEVLSTKVVEGPYGNARKMLVKTRDGWKVWSTVPSSVAIEKGDKIKFEAYLERSQDDVKFGFASRPTKAEVLA